MTPGTGLELSALQEAALGIPLSDVGFTLYKVNDAYTVTSVTTTAQALSNATIIDEQMTDANGEAKWSNLELGYYVLRETTPPVGGFAPAEDAIITMPLGITSSGVGWNHDIHVYPKNVRTGDISKEVANAQASYKVGDTVSWKIFAKIKDTLFLSGSYGAMEITDVLDERLDFTANSDVVLAHGGTPPDLALVRGTDYTVTPTGNTIVWALTNAGMEKVTTAGATTVSIVFDAAINAKATDGSAGLPTIANGGSMSWKNHDNSVSGTPVIDETQKPKIALSGIVINKVDSITQSTMLDGAKFKIADSISNARNGDYIKRGADSTVDIEITTGNNPSTLATEKGWAMITGLPLNASSDTKYYLVEVQAPTGYVLRRNMVEVTIAQGSQLITAVILNQKIGSPPLTEESPTFVLPYTGGIGTILFTGVGIGLIMVAFVVFYRTRKKSKNPLPHTQKEK